MFLGTLGLFRSASTRVRTFAHLGENESQLVQRFGRAFIRQPDVFVFHGRTLAIGERLSFMCEPWRLTATLIEDRCERIQYFKSGGWSEAWLASLLAENLGGFSWVPIPSAAPRIARDWTRDDGATAAWRTASGFTIASPSYLETVDRLQRTEVG